MTKRQTSRSASGAAIQEYGCRSWDTSRHLIRRRRLRSTDFEGGTADHGILGMSWSRNAMGQEVDGSRPLHSPFTDIGMSPCRRS